MTFSFDLIQKVVAENYGLNCQIKPLAGHADYNFCLIAKNGQKYLLKIGKPEVSSETIDFQVELLNYIESKDLDFDVPSIIPTRHGESSFVFISNFQNYPARMHSWVEGRMLGHVHPRTDQLYRSWGETCGMLSSALQGFDHPEAHRFDKWNPVESLHSKVYIDYFNSEEEKVLAKYFWGLFEKAVPEAISDMRHSVNYGDAHELNLLLDGNKKNNKISGVIDFGDAIYSPTICELAIACAYAGMDVADPIAAMCTVVEGYHSQFEIEEKELSVLFPLICGRLMISVSSAARSLKMEPENEYHQVSAKPAWDLLRKLRNIAPEFVHFSFRAACDYEPHPNHSKFNDWQQSSKDSISSPIHLNNKNVVTLDLSVGSLDLGHNSNFEKIPAFVRRIDKIMFEKNADIGIGGWGEIRPFYTTDAYKVEGNNGPQWRTTHLGVDYWVPAETEVVAYYDGEVVSIYNNDNPCDYGPTIIIQHKIQDDITFYTLYGHLSEASMSHCHVGQKVKAGENIAWVGNENVNGGWPPHLHFQIVLDLFGNTRDFPGVAYVSETEVWLSNSPLPIGCPNQYKNPDIAFERLLKSRKEDLGKSLSISYDKPLHIVRGSGIYLYDSAGRRYIDTVNNVAHVGHEHPRVVAAAQRQIELLNTNTRYLHENIVKYADLLLSKCPEEMGVVYFVNSGSEANELALRMAKMYSSQNDIIAIESGYHGNTGACIDVSSYKFNGKGGSGAPDFTTIVPMPDVYRGKFKDVKTAGKDYARDVEHAIQTIQSKDRKVAGFIAESILSCGGQIVLPPNYLSSCYKTIRDEGGLCIADEVQVGFGRVGDHFWGFELQGVVPDIITCGKPIGNGHPLAAVITKREVAEAFTNGMEFFNTFGGNPVSCAIGHEVLNVIEDESLQQNAKRIGTQLFNGLKRLKDKYAIIGDVRGVGLFLGFEMVKDRNTLAPAAEEAIYLVNRMRVLGILMSTDGPLHNVIKIKPPMCISKSNADEILERLDQVLAEDFLRV